MTITGSNTVNFTQTLVGGDLFVNDSVGSSSNKLDFYRQLVTADTNGEINVTVAPGAGSAGVALAGLALQPIFTPTIAATLSISPTGANKAEGNAGNTPLHVYGHTKWQHQAVRQVWTMLSPDRGRQMLDFGGASYPSGTVNFADGENAQVITIDVSGDLIPNPTRASPSRSVTQVQGPRSRQARRMERSKTMMDHRR